MPYLKTMTEEAATTKAIEEVNAAMAELEAGPKKLCDLVVLFQGGQVVATEITEDDLEEADVENVEELIEKALTDPARPHWAWLGDIHFYTQVVSGIQVREEN